MLKLIVLIMALLFFQGLDVQAQGLVIGENIYRYTSKELKAPGELEDLRMHQYEFPCVHKSEILESDIPRTAYVLEHNDGKIILGLEEEILIWKGIDGKDPFLQVNDKYLQFRGGVPIFNFADPQDFEFNDAFNLYIEYKSERLPDDLKAWAEAKGYEKLKLKTELSYQTHFLKVIYTREDKSKPSVKLSRDISFKVLSLKGMKEGKWEDLESAAHSVLNNYFQDQEISDVRISDKDNPMGTVIFQSSPEMVLSFNSDVNSMQIPVCEPGLNQVHVYPNPSFGQLNLALIDMEPGDYTFDIYNLVGYKMWSEKIQLNSSKALYNYDLSTLETGIYIYGLKDYRGAYVQTRRLVLVEH